MFVLLKSFVLNFNYLKRWSNQCAINQPVINISGPFPFLYFNCFSVSSIIIIVLYFRYYIYCYCFVIIIVIIKLLPIVFFKFIVCSISSTQFIYFSRVHYFGNIFKYITFFYIIYLISLTCITKLCFVFTIVATH